ncbi:circularly permuted type 2 ATP-grasp protein [Acetobacter sp. AN02]|uniref:circularly permuted type 2 ATP-grasp protein n=1 Tax=Acetobacter sp. AN02 TaxID=2894186 RepID=UPI0024341458|nr:circularly permuted type 2 ATP-grasp protein [Acetobacter sp. AN02]MDG6094367.1 circularly permuted type 2 ATP-grasp protein [Acetobacter sp. AN02]
MTHSTPLDEMVDGQGGVRPRWRRLLSTISELGAQELAERGGQISVALRDQMSQRPEAGTMVAPGCDPVPLILDAAEFADLEAGIIQRARLLEALLQDAYGERRILSSGVLPPSLLWSSRTWLSVPQTDGCPPTDRFFSFFAVDLVRENDGRWSVLGDRLSRANGAGRALENRRQMVRVLPELFSGYDLRHISPFMDLWQEALLGAATRTDPETNSPALALLTPGPQDPHWPEHVLLARELGCTLAEGGDLSARQGELWLKTVRGLRPVDVLLIRQDAATLDPLELDGTGAWGITGLLDVARGGAVRLMNDPRAGYAETPGLLPFFPELSRFLLGEDLLLRTVRAFWPGDVSCPVPQDGWHVMSATDGDSTVRRYGEIPAEECAAFSERRWEHMALEIDGPSVTPALAGECIEPHPVVLRMFAAFDGEQWNVLPGGLARISRTAQDLLAPGRIRSGMVSKDVWVLAGNHEERRGMAFIPSRRLPIRRAHGDLPSRAAEDFFWLGRYLERVEGAARMMRVILSHLSVTDLSPRERADIDGLVRLLRAAKVIEDVPVSGYSLVALTRELLTATAQEGLFMRSFRSIDSLAPELSDRLTREMRHFIVYGAEDLMSAIPGCRARGDDPARSLERLSRVMERVVGYSATISGFSAENMLRSGGRLFLDMGRRFERTGTVLLTCSTLLDQPGLRQRGRMESALRLMLELCDSSITYRSRYFGVMQPAPVLDLLLLDEDNPRGAGYQLATLRQAMASVAEGGDGVRDDLPRGAQEILDGLRGLAQSVFDAADQDVAAADLPAGLRAVTEDLELLSDRLTRACFTVLVAPRRVDSSDPSPGGEGLPAEDGFFA